MEIYGKFSSGGGAGLGWCSSEGAFNAWRNGTSQSTSESGSGDLNVDFYASRNWTGSTSVESTNHTHSFTTGTPSSSIYISNGAVRPLTTYSNMIIKY